jgi:hypothetical protein
MSQENVEVVRQALRAMDQGLDRVAEFWDPDIDWRAIEQALRAWVLDRRLPQVRES